MKLDKASKLVINEVPKIIIIVIIVVMVVAIIFGAVLILKSYINSDKNYYNSLEEIANSYYPEQNSTYVQSGDYCYIIAENGNIAKRKLVLKTTEEKYIVFNNWLEETKNTEYYLQAKDIYSKDFYSIIHVTIHNGSYIIMVERHFINDERLEAVIYDNYGEWQPIKLSESHEEVFYYKVLGEHLIDSDYELRVDIGQDSYYLWGLKELSQGK